MFWKVEKLICINYINIFGNNNKIFSKNIPRRNYFDHGLVNTLIIKRFNFHDRNRNRDNWDSDSEESLVEKRYFDISDFDNFNLIDDFLYKIKLKRGKNNPIEIN